MAEPTQPRLVATFPPFFTAEDVADTLRQIADEIEKGSESDSIDGSPFISGEWMLTDERLGERDF